MNSSDLEQKGICLTMTHVEKLEQNLEAEMQRIAEQVEKALGKHSPELREQLKLAKTNILQAEIESLEGILETHKKRMDALSVEHKQEVDRIMKTFEVKFNELSELTEKAVTESTNRLKEYEWISSVEERHKARTEKIKKENAAESTTILWIMAAITVAIVVFSFVLPVEDNPLIQGLIGLITFFV